VKQLLLIIILIITSLPLLGQRRFDLCTDFTTRYKRPSAQRVYYGSAQHSIRHTIYRAALDFGTSTSIHTGGPSYSRINFNGGVRLKFNDGWGIHQDWVIQLHDRSWDTLFQTKDIELVVGYAGTSIGYEWYDERPVLGYTYMGIGTGRGKTFTNPAHSLVWVSKTRHAINNNSYLQFASFWEFNDIFNLYDDNIMWSISMGWYLGRFSKYKR